MENASRFPPTLDTLRESTSVHRATGELFLSGKEDRTEARSHPPAGVLQLQDVLQNGYWHARRLTYLMEGTFHTLEWARAAADGLFLLAGVVPLVAAVAVLLLGSRERPRNAPQAETR